MTSHSKLTDHPRKLALGRTLLFGWNYLVVTIWIIGPFIAAATIKWLAGLIHLGVLLLGLMMHRTYVSRRNSELIKRRQQIGEGTKQWDIIWNILFWPIMASMAILGGVQYHLLHFAHGRFHQGTTALPLPFLILGVGIFTIGMFLNSWAMATNRHFEGTVRIQTEIDHQVVTNGPYRFVRHPGYLGLCLWALATPFLLLSTLAMISATIAIAWIILRTKLEDSTLKQELAGYAEYASRVHYRLIPGLW